MVRLFLSRVIILILVISFSGYSQTKNKYLNPQFANLSRDHKVIALLPFKVIFDNSAMKSKLSYDDLKKLQKEEAYAFQDKLYFVFLSKQQKWRLPISVQEIEKTRSLLTKNNIDYFSLPEKEKKELAKILGVDAVLYGTLRLNNPMSETASAVIGVFTGIWFATSEAYLDVQLYDGKTGTLLWRESSQYAGYGDSNELANYLAKRIWKRIPYRQK